ncbi:hypothetical protein BBJ28_00008640 [Nothophytophthora sp. Chile5]|nr:hypothetical protein BBJ28_00008640 [Nothophytophthora sp. Chile5]
MKLVWTLSVGLLALVLSLTPADAQSCGTRVRRDWDALSTADKTTYKEALAAAMDSGAYIKFVEMHTEMQSEMEAHRQCMFIYWHRLLLVVFENMLRGQGTQYQCVTVPYFNWVGANNRVLTGSCSSLGDCSAIMKELGGYTVGSQSTLTINGVTGNSGRCVTEAPLNHFCQSGSVTGAACAHCVPRGAWGSASVPTTTSYASIRQQVFNGKNIGEMSPLVEQGCHNNVHANLAGTMGTFASPSDPIFWSHHAMVDALHTIFHKCRVGTQRLTFAQKAADPVAWTSCSRRDGGVFDPTDVITMRTGVNGVNPIEGSQDSVIGQYFSGVPNQFAGLMDVRDLGDSSYSYELSGQLASMYNDCDGTSTPAPTTTAPTPTTTTPTPTSTTRTPVSTTRAPVSTTRAPVSTTRAPVPTTRAPVATAAPTPTPRTGRGWSWLNWLRNHGHSRNLEAEHGHHKSNNCADTNDQQTGVSTNAPTIEPSTMYQDDNVDVIIVDDCSISEQRVSAWYDESLAAMGGQCPENMADLERQACMFENQCLGGTADYSDEFKAVWGVVEPRCLTIVNAINSGEQSILYEAWRETMEAHFGCPTPANATSVDQNAGYGGVTDVIANTISDAMQSV